MIKVKIICLGMLKEKYLREAFEEYRKRLSRFCDFEAVEIAPVKLPEKPSQNEITAALGKEAELIINKIPAGSRVFSLCIEGKGYSSEKFAEIIAENQSAGKNMVFIIGSSYGLSDKVKELSDIKLSLSQMTFPHQLFRVMLAEQIYRAFMINEGSTYHK